MSDPIKVRDELVDRFLKTRAKGTVSLASAPRSQRSVQMMQMVAGVSTGAALMTEEPITSRVHAIGISEMDREPSVVVFVTRKLPESYLPDKTLIPRELDGVRTSVVESPIARLAVSGCNRKRKVRPLIAGVSISRADGPSGTLGAFVRSKRPEDQGGLFLLSNSHVLAPQSGRVAGTPIVQSSTDDGEAETIASVLRATKLNRTVPISADAAVARLADDVRIVNSICEIGRVTGKSSPAKDMIVEKHGRTSGKTAGRITTVGLTAQVEDPERGIELTFLNLFRVDQFAGEDDPVAQLGDSGSLVVEQSSRTAVGLLHAADECGAFYYAHPIEDVLNELEIELELGDEGDGQN